MAIARRANSNATLQATLNLVEYKMKMRKLGTGGPNVSAIGLGCMGLSFGLGPATDRSEAVKVIRTAVDRGVTLFDTAEAYGPWTNEDLVGEALQPVRDQVLVCTRFGFDIDARGETVGLNSQPTHIRVVVGASLKRPASITSIHRLCTAMGTARRWLVK